MVDWQRVRVAVPAFLAPIPDRVLTVAAPPFLIRDAGAAVTNFG